MISLKTVLLIFSRSVHFITGAIRYWLDGRTPEQAYQSMVGLFCLTGGVSNDIVSGALSLTRRPYALPNASGLLGELSVSDVKQAVSRLDEQGYYVFERRLPSDLCDRLLDFSLRNRCGARNRDGLLTSVDCYPRHRPQAVRYDFFEQDVICNPDVQTLMADLSIIVVAQSYLRCQPLADVTAMWWNTDYLKEADKAAAQFWHFDMDRIKWLKFFIYLTDVEDYSGPHSFVAGSHRSGGIPRGLLEKGYSRLTDEEVGTYFPPERIVEMVAPRGTVIAEDTRGLHKGKNVLRGDRLMLQLQFSNSLFGGNYPPAWFGDRLDASLKIMLKTYPRIYANYTRERATGRAATNAWTA